MRRDNDTELARTVDGPPVPMPSFAELEPGTVVDHFKVQRLLGAGGMGRVYLARDTKLGRRVALKLIQPALLGSARARAAFEREARMTARFNHPNIVAIYAVGEHEGSPYVALEYVEGETLRARMEAFEISRAETVRVGLAIAEALAEAHRHDVLHRDLKPENVVVGTDGRPRVLDFGLAKRLEAEAGADGADRLKPETMQGTPQYLAPERWQGGADSPAADVWSLGCVLFELVTDRVPFMGATVPELFTQLAGPIDAPRVDTLADAPPELADLIEACLSKQPEARPHSAEVADRLRGLLPGRQRRLADDASPYRGLLPFTERHAALFFGRDAEIGAFVERIRLAAVLAVVGPSGSGKTSFVRAGVIPRLHEQERWLVLTVRPGAEPFRALATCLSSRHDGRRSSTGDVGRSNDSIPLRSGDPEERERLARALEKTPGRIALELRSLGEARGARVLLYLEALEELFTLCPDPDVRRRFLDGVFAAADDNHDPVRVALTLRDDFLGRLATSPVARRALRDVVVLERPSLEALVQMIVEPAAAAGYAFEDDELPREIARAVLDEPGALPLLSFVADELWKLRDRKRELLLRSSYEQLGGVEGAIARHADGVLAKLASVDVPIARDLLLRLVTPERTRRTTTREEALDRLAVHAEAVLDRLVDARLVVTQKARDDAPGREQLELVHESLLVRWPTLSRWIDAGREELAFVSEVKQAAARWDNRGRDPDALWHGDELRDALRLRARVTTELPGLAEAFLTAANRRQTRQRRRRRLLVGATLAILSIASLLLAILSSRLSEEKERAEEQRSEAMLEDARSTVHRGRLLEGRAKLRTALEERDSTGARALYWQLARDPLVWRRELGVAARAVQLSLDGETVFAGADDGSVRFIDAATGEMQQLRGHADKIQRLCHSSDGSLVATGDGLGRIIVWSAEGRRRLRVIEAGSAVVGLAFSPDGALLSGGIDGAVRTWNAETGERGRTLHRGDSPIRSLDVSADGRLLAVGDDAGRVHVVAVEGAEAPRTLGIERGPVQVVRFDRDASMLAATGHDGEIELYRTVSWERTGTIDAHASKITDVQFSADGELIATASFDQSVGLWDARTLEPVGRFDGHASYVYALSFSPDGRSIASAAYDRTVQLWRVDRLDGRAVERGHTDRALSLAFAPDGARLVSAGADHTVRSWDVATGAEEQVFRGHDAEVWGVSVSASGGQVASGSSDQTIRLWDAGSGALERIVGGHAADVDDVQFSPDGRFIASTGADGAIRIWDVERESTSQLLSGHQSVIYRIAFDRRGRRLVSAGADFSVRVWDVATGELLGEVPDHGNRVRDARFAPDGRILSGGDDGRALLSELGTTERTAFAHPRRVQTLDAHPDGALIVTGSADGLVRIWSASGELRHTMTGHRGLVYMTRFSPDGRLVASAGDDGTVRMWEADRGRPSWRAPALLPGSARLLTHRGWSHLDEAHDGSPSSGLAAALDRALVERTRLASTHDDLLCSRTYENQIEVWSIRSGTRAVGVARPAARHVRAIDGGCLVSGDDGVEVIHADGSTTSLSVADPVTALAEGPEIVVSTSRELIAFSPSGDVQDRVGVGEGVTAVARRNDASFVVGYRDGSIEVLAGSQSEHGRQGPGFFERHPASAARRIVVGPRDTVLVGFDDGVVGMWNLADGRHLGQARLHGPVVHVALESDSFYAATELGDHVRWDVSAFSTDWCALLRRLWPETPVVWKGGRIVRASPPPDHACR